MVCNSYCKHLKTDVLSFPEHPIVCHKSNSGLICLSTCWMSTNRGMILKKLALSSSNVRIHQFKTYSVKKVSPRNKWVFCLIFDMFRHMTYDFKANFFNIKSNSDKLLAVITTKSYQIEYLSWTLDEVLILDHCLLLPFSAQKCQIRLSSQVGWELP